MWCYIQLRMKYWGLILIFMVNISYGQSLLRNDREGLSYFFKKDISSYINEDSTRHASEVWEESVNSISPRLKNCAFSIVDALKTNTNKDIDELLIVLRRQSIIDDIVYARLAKVIEFHGTKVSKSLVLKNKGNTEIEAIYKDFVKQNENGQCLSDNYKSLYAKIAKVYAEDFKKVKSRHIKRWNNIARKNNWIDLDTFELLEKARKVDLTGSKSLSDYVQTKSVLRSQFELYNVNEKADFVTEKVKKTKLSRRMLLYKKYSYIQISLMAQVIERLRDRLMSNKVEILRYDNETGEVVERIALTPMEIFHFAIDILRKEMNELKTNSFFNGVSPSYEELIVAAYEVGQVAGSELDSLDSIEEIWNPTKTTWEKSQVWVKTFITISSVVLPPPYGMIPILALVIIEAVTQQNKDQGDDGVSHMF